MVSFKSLGNFSLSNSLCLVEDTSLAVAQTFIPNFFLIFIYFFIVQGRNAYVEEREWRLLKNILSLASGTANSLIHQYIIESLWFIHGILGDPGRISPWRMWTVSIWLSFKKESKPPCKSESPQTWCTSPVTHKGYPISSSRCHLHSGLRSV